MRAMKSLSAIFLLIALAACSGGDSGSSSNTGGSTAGGTSGGGTSGGGTSGGGTSGGGSADFGLTARAPLAALNIPLGAGSIGSYQLENAFPGLNFPAAVFLTAVPGQDRLVVIRQSGLVEAFTDDAAASASSVVLDLRGVTTFGGEQGLLGLAFDPDFVLNRYFYVHYSIPSPHRSRIARFTWDAGTDQAVPGSQEVLLDILQPFSNHNAGMLAFGPDGYLYIAMGDGGSGGDPDNHAQDVSDLLGSMLRIDVHRPDPGLAYGIPLDNPSITNPVAGAGPARPETWAFGLRNPFRFSFDRNTGVLWLGDVGQAAREEIDVIEAGGNYGWRVFEGTLPFNDSLNTLPDSAFTPPVWDYGRDQGVTVIGGYVYRGSRISSLQGRYVYGDWGSGNIWALNASAATGAFPDNQLIAQVSANSLTSFGETADGDLLAVTGQGTLYRFEETMGGTPTEPPPLLSQTGLFSSLESLTPASGVIEYDLSLPFWSDGAEKRRWIAVPDGQTIDFSARDAWRFPVGTVIVKHFELVLTEGDPSSLKRLETRLLVHRSSGWSGYTYRWNDAGTEAVLLTGRELASYTIALAGGGSREQLYEYPSRTDCLRCHTEAGGFVLGVRTLQLNRDFDYPNATDNQLRSWNNIGLFTSDIGAATAYDAYPALDDAMVTSRDRSRAYLAVNCAPCHQPGGPAPSSMDLRYDTADSAAGIIDVVPDAGGLGLTDPRLVAPGAPERSVLVERMRRLDGTRMPPVGSHLVDQMGVALLEGWIRAL
jgi:uncharacterized repeat protein (TIGR03806 family)